MAAPRCTPGAWGVVPKLIKKISFGQKSNRWQWSATLVSLIFPQSIAPELCRGMSPIGGKADNMCSL